MKLHLLLFALSLSVSYARPPVEFVITDSEGHALGTVGVNPSEEAVEDPDLLDPSRIKRSGDLFGFIKNGISAKLGQIASASGGAVAHFSKHSSGGHGSPYEGKSFNFFSLKKSILNTLLQAVKAIKGGVLAIKGQLIKGGGNLIQAKGRLVTMKGEAISNLGKHFISSAMFQPQPHHDHFVHPDEISHSGPGHTHLVHHGPAAGVISSPAFTSYGPPSGHGHSGQGALPTGPSHIPTSNFLPAKPAAQYVPVYGPPAQSYGAPSGHGGSYLPQKFNAALEGNYEGLYEQAYVGHY